MKDIQQNLVCFNTFGADESWTLATYEKFDGYKAWRRILAGELKPEEVIEPIVYTEEDGFEESDRGFFTAHRDNLSPATAHRRFGLTLNLNDDYDGGELRFPEYGPDRYRPDAGEALVFSGSHLHEVLPVTRGRRFVLLSFLFRDAPEAVGRQGAATR